MNREEVPFCREKVERFLRRLGVGKKRCQPRLQERLFIKETVFSAKDICTEELPVAVKSAKQDAPEAT